MGLIPDVTPPVMSIAMYNTTDTASTGSALSDCGIEVRTRKCIRPIPITVKTRRISWGAYGDCMPLILGAMLIFR